MNIRPIDLPALRIQLADHGRKVTPEGIREGLRRSGSGKISDDWVEYTVRENRQETDRLSAADLYFVSGDMADLASSAADSMPDFTLAHEDVPSRCGFIYFESPLLFPGNPDGVQTWAASWGPLAPVYGGIPGIWITWFSGKSKTFTSAIEAVNPFLATAMASVPRLLPLSNAQVPFGDDGAYGEAREGAPYNSARRGWLRILKATWLLMEQPIASVEDARYDRPARRRLQKQGYEPPRVRVITLRRAKSSADHGESDREYHHQWIVRGHWRQQYYPSRGVHRPVWIAPHIKGPEGAPLIGGEKVYAWTR
ncbi:hypothetical protein AB0F88_40110 [Streptosporangium sp. NPDC023963]|uniref:hypothetical protein n=1 Tax=Streptosporangium sp. NPDC023963 TaxID=3155608 RepID=UPI0034275FA9